jgi:hypothetical protein
VRPRGIGGLTGLAVSSVVLASPVVPAVLSVVATVVGSGIGGRIGEITVVDPVVVAGPVVNNIGAIVGSTSVVAVVAALVLSSSPQAAAPSVTASTVLRTSAGPGGSGVSPRPSASDMLAIKAHRARGCQPSGVGRSPATR